MSIETIDARRKAQAPAEVEQVMKVRDLLRRGALVAAGQSQDDVATVVRGIIDEVARGGDQAVIELTERIDHVKLTAADICVPAEAIEAAHAAADPRFLALARRVVANIRAYQEHIKIQAPPDLVRDGRRLGVRYTPMERVGVYVPGWKAIYPSSVLMTVVPAKVAGVSDIAIAAPPTRDGVNPMTLALAKELEVNRVYRVGGAIAIAAMALGTQSIDRVQMVAGPGNAYVAEAKLQLAGQVAIDSVAGASEVLIIADGSAEPAWLAADMLAQAEHNPASSVLVTDSEELARQVERHMDIQLPKLDRADVIRHAIDSYGAIILVNSIGDACDLANYFAPEHLQIITRDDKAALARIKHAGAIFLGAHTPVPVGDYHAGPSHVLPTRGLARQSSALSVNSFLKASSVLHYDAAALAEDADDIEAFARHEGLTAHAAAVRIREEKKQATKAQRAQRKRE